MLSGVGTLERKIRGPKQRKGPEESKAKGPEGSKQRKHKSLNGQCAGESGLFL